MASLSISKVEECLQQLEAEIGADQGSLHWWWTKLMEAYYPYPFERQNDVRAPYWRDMTMDRLITLQEKFLREIGELENGSQSGRRLHGVSREILRRQMEAIKNDGIEFLNGKGYSLRLVRKNK